MQLLAGRRRRRAGYLVYSKELVVSANSFPSSQSASCSLACRQASTMADLKDQKEFYGGVEQIENGHASDGSERSAPPSEFTPEEQRRIIHRIDRRLIITVGIMYCISLMDRTNLSAAAIAGMTKELNLIGFRYVRLMRQVSLFRELTNITRASSPSSSSHPTYSSNRRPRLPAKRSARESSSPAFASCGDAFSSEWGSSTIGMSWQD